MSKIIELLNEQQKERLDNWLSERPSTEIGAIGGRYTYSFTPTSLGLIVKVIDAAGGEINLTEYEDW